MKKSVRNSFIDKPDDEPFTEEEIEYAAQDVMWLPALMEKQLEFIKKYDMEFLLRLEQDFLPVLADIELEGQWLDKVKWKKVADSNAYALKKIEKRLDKLIRSSLLNDLSKLDVKCGRDKKVAQIDSKELIINGKPFKKKKFRQNELNYSSHTQIKSLARYLGEELDSTGEEYLLEYIKNKPDSILRSFINLLLVYREYKKSVTTYGEDFFKYLNPVTGKIHTEFTQCLTSTGRLSSTKPNVQNLPKLNTYRNCFVAAKGRKLATIDLANCELRILASFSQDDILLSNFNADGDFHSTLAQIAYRVKYNDPNGIVNSKTNKSFRNVMKNVNFAICYGAEAYRIAKYLDISVEKAQVIYDNMKQMLPQMFDTLESYPRYARTHGYILANERTKRRRWFGEYLNGDNYPDYKIRTESMNFPIQATNADIVKEICVEVSKMDIDAKVVSIVHDECIFDIPAEGAQEIGNKLKETMITVANRYLQPNISMGADMQIKDYWNK